MSETTPVMKRDIGFDDAFAAARGLGFSEFEWRNKRYTTRLATKEEWQTIEARRSKQRARRRRLEKVDGFKS